MGLIGLMGPMGLPEFIVLVLVPVLVLVKFERLGNLSVGVLHLEVISKMPGKYDFEHEDEHEHEDDLADVGCFDQLQRRTKPTITP
jgi:hypothetical protein